MLLRDLRPGVTVHGFRSAFKDWGKRSNQFPGLPLGGRLGACVRRQGASRVRQERIYFEKRRRLMEAWAQHCQREAALAEVCATAAADQMTACRARSTALGEARMAREPNAIHLQPAWEFFKYCCIQAEAKIASGQEPDWFPRATLMTGIESKKEYGLPPWWPLLVALALDLSFEMTADSLSTPAKAPRLSGLALRSSRAGPTGTRDFPEFPLISLNDPINGDGTDD
jgi:hypothetical protein